jgi:hypothetical protein
MGSGSHNWNKVVLECGRFEERDKKEDAGISSEEKTAEILEREDFREKSEPDSWRGGVRGRKNQEMVCNLLKPKRNMRTVPDLGSSNSGQKPT